MRRRSAIVLGMVLALVPSWPASGQAEDDSITTIVDGSTLEPPIGFERPSLVLDGDGYPVVVFWGWDGQVWLAHCNDPFCAGGDESVNLVEQISGGGLGAAIVLDAGGNPILAFGSETGLHVVHCNDPNCSGDDETMNTIGAQEAESVALMLDAAGNPVVAFEAGVPPLALWLLRCNDPDCSGGDETVNLVEDPGGTFVSLALVGRGFPVMVHHAWETGDVRLVRCNDPACAGGDEVATSLRDAPSPRIRYTAPSLVLDADDLPVISFVLDTPLASHLMVMHCDDPQCERATRSIVAAIEPGGPPPSLALDPSGNPVVAYSDTPPLDESQTNLMVARCTDPDCADAARSLVNVDLAERVSWDPSIVVDAAGRPVVAYIGFEYEEVKLARCDDVACLSALGDLDRDGIADAEDNCASQFNQLQADPDLDGLGDVCDPDDDNDGVLDGDDPDDDNDGVLDLDDVFPTDPTEWLDADFDGTGDNADLDDDDGQSDADEVACGSDPYDVSSQSPDSDGDGVPDCVDPPIATLPPTGSSSVVIVLSALALVFLGHGLRQFALLRERGVSGR